MLEEDTLPKIVINLPWAVEPQRCSGKRDLNLQTNKQPVILIYLYFDLPNTTAVQFLI